MMPVSAAPSAKAVCWALGSIEPARSRASPLAFARSARKRFLEDGLCLVPVLAYTERTGLANSEEVRRLFWGRTGSELSLIHI